MPKVNGRKFPFPYLCPMPMQEFKSKVLGALREQVMEYAEQTEMALDFAKESRDNETKSTAGDKYETGRAMADIEVQKLEMQKAKHQQMLAELARVEIGVAAAQAGLGSLIKTDLNLYFLSIGLGRVVVDGQNVVAVSPASPIGQVLLGARAGQKLVFQEKEFTVLEIG